MTEPPGLGEAVVKELRSVYALKAGALSMFDPLLRRVAAAREADETPSEVAELLGRMHERFSEHRAETAAHAAELASRVEQLGGDSTRARIAVLGTGARAWVALGDIGGQNYGANARNAFVFEHLEIASLKMLCELAQRADDRSTAELAQRCLEQDQEMAATIDRNWPNVVTLALAS